MCVVSVCVLKFYYLLKTKSRGTRSIHIVLTYSKYIKQLYLFRSMLISEDRGHWTLTRTICLHLHRSEVAVTTCCNLFEAIASFTRSDHRVGVRPRTRLPSVLLTMTSYSRLLSPFRIMWPKYAVNNCVQNY